MNAPAYTRNSHCAWCGAAFEASQPWPRRCATCANTTFLNPTPVAVALVQIGDGLLAIRRGIPPHIGQLALPGGFIDLGETWQQAAAREVFEETQLQLDPADFRVFDVHSASNGVVLIFGHGPRLEPADLPTFTPTAETSERVILTARTPLAFPLHTLCADRFFDTLGT